MEKTIFAVAKDFVVNVLADRVAQVYYKNKLVKTFGVKSGDDWCHIDIDIELNGNKLVDLNVYHCDVRNNWHATIYQVSQDEQTKRYSTMTEFDYIKVDCFALRTKGNYRHIYKEILGSREHLIIHVGMYSEEEARRVLEDRLAQERAEGYVEDKLGWVNKEDGSYSMELTHKDNEGNVIWYYNDVASCTFCIFEEGK